MRPYLQILSLDNGYRFFAPEPGPSHLVRYDVTLADGQQIGGVFPNLAEERPRLLYHRYFMLSEFVNSLTEGTPPELVEPMPDRTPSTWLTSIRTRKVKLYLRSTTGAADRGDSRRPQARPTRNSYTERTLYTLDGGSP